jgi:hypothetical protein
MCNFLSAIVIPKAGGDFEIYRRPDLTDAHEDLIRAWGITERETTEVVRVEYTIRDGGKWGCLDDYHLIIDECIIPKWFGQTAQKRVAETLRAQIEKMIVRDVSDKFLLGGRWVVTDSTVVAQNAHLFLLGHSSAKLLGRSSAELLGHSSAKLWDHSSAELRDHSSAELWDHSSAELRDHSSAELLGYSSAELWDHSSAELLGYSSAKLWDHSSAKLRDHSSAEQMSRTITINDDRINATKETQTD